MRLLWLRPLLPVLLAVQTALAATTVDKKVDCDKGDSITAEAADLAVDKIYVLHVSGTCNENVVINDFEGVSLTVIGDPSATIQGLFNNPGQPVFFVANSRRVTLVNLSIQTSGGSTPNDNPFGVAFNLCRGCQVSNSTINTKRGGIDLINSQAVITSITVNGSTAQGTTGLMVRGDSNANVVNLTATGGAIGGVGLLVDEGSRVRLSAMAPSDSVIRNYSVGIIVRGSSLLEAQAQCNPSGCIEVRDSLINGVQVNSGQAVFNGVNVTLNRQGIVVQNAGTLSYAGPGSITQNTGNGSASVGVLVSHNSHAAIIGVPVGGTGTTNITGNGGRGVAVASNSSVQFLGPAGSINITGNNGGNNLAANIACDGSSLITGTNMLAAGSTINCADQQVPFLPIP